jgi:hypothetical protein
MCNDTLAKLWRKAPYRLWGRSLGPWSAGIAPNVTSSLILLIMVASAAPLRGQTRGEGPLARPPVFPPEVESVFFPDARKELVGPRPNYESGSHPKQQAVAAGGANSTAKGESGYAWSELVDADTIEAEIKRQVAPLGPLVASPSTFKGGAYRDCRERFNTLAVLFAVAADYDDTVRWQDTAPALAHAFARASGNCKVGTDQSYREAQQRVQELGELVRGGRPSVTAPPTTDDSWESKADRTPIMVRMEQSLNKQITPNLSSGRDLSANAEDLRHEAQILAMLAQVLTEQGLPDAGDETYDGYAQQLRDGAKALVVAIDQENFDSARTALGNMSKACSTCHDDYR